MPLQLVRNDITKMQVDAIVNAAKSSLLGGGGVDGAIHEAAGPELLEACRALGGCPVGEARITPGYRLPCRYVIHTVGPHWRGGLFGEKRQLESCYRSALELAWESGCETVAFPLISAGHYGYPKDKAMQTALGVIGDFLMEHEMTVYLVLYGRESVDIGHRLFADIQEYIDDEETRQNRRRRGRTQNAYYSGAPEESFLLDADTAPTESMPYESVCYSADMVPEESGPRPAAPRPALFRPAKAKADKTPRPQETAAETTVCLDRIFNELDESFQQMLLRKIDESGMTDAQCYKKANVDRKLFSKIRSDVHYRPSKPTAIAFAIALELDLWETEELLRKAGFALSRSNRFDLIIRYFVERRIYDIFQINEVLFYYDQSLLGA